MVRYNWRDMPCTGYKNCQLYDAKSNLPVPPFIKAVEDGSHLRPKLKFSPSGL